jgi:hypothetical protein
MLARGLHERLVRPNGIRYSLTLHAPDNTRLIGFDNAHGVKPVGSRF